MRVYDHAHEVKNYPKKFGVSVEDVATLNPSLRDDYNALRLLAMKRGWVRVRSSRAATVAVEAWPNSRTPVITAVAGFLKRRRFGLLTSVTMNDLKGRQVIAGTLQDFLRGPRSSQQAAFGANENLKLDALCKRVEGLRAKRARSRVPGSRNATAIRRGTT
jgi:hypothetical protein